MIYRAIGLMSGSSLDGLDIACVEFQETGGKWGYEFLKTSCHEYGEWKEKLQSATSLSAKEYLLLHTDYGHYIGKQVNRFIEENQLQYQVHLIASHGHTVFHSPSHKMTAQLGDGAAIAAETGINTVSDLRSLDIAFGGEGAPIVPIGERWLLGDFNFYLNLGGIANISFNSDKYIAFDICANNRVLNLLAAELGKEYDEGGKMASQGKINRPLLEQLNKEEYYKRLYPKSLANEFGTEIIYPVIKQAGCDTTDALRTYVEHVVVQIENAVKNFQPGMTGSMLVTGGGALNDFLINRLTDELKELNIEVVVPSHDLINFKEAMIMAFIGVLRWRQENNVLSSVTGATRDSIGGALWIGQEG